MDTYIYEKAKRIASGYVGARMYTCHEIEERLVRKKIDKETAEKVVCDFASAGLLDDREYAKLYVSEAVRLSGKGMYRIRQELMRKGVAKGIIDDVCGECEDDTYSALKEYVESRGLCDGITTRRDLEKLKARLARRGYSLSEIKKCISEFEIHFEDEY